MYRVLTNFYEMYNKNMDTEQIKNNIFNYLKEGMYKKDSAIMAGISEATFYRWVEEDESFKSRVEASILEYKHSLIKNVNICAIKDGKLALEVLKRRFPKEWDERLNVEEKQEYEGSTRQVADLLQKILREGDEKRAENEQVVDTS